MVLVDAATPFFALVGVLVDVAGVESALEFLRFVFVDTWPHPFLVAVLPLDFVLLQWKINTSAHHTIRHNHAVLDTLITLRI